MSDDRAQTDGIVPLCRWALKFSLRRWSGLMPVLLAMLLKTALDVLAPWPMKILVDNVLGHRPFPAAVARFLGTMSPPMLLTLCIAAMVLLFLSAWAIGLLSALASIGFGQRMIYDLAADLFGHLQRMSLRYYAQASTGDLIRRVTTDCGAVSIIVKDALLPVASSTFSLVAMFCIMYRIDWGLTLLAMGVAPFMVIIFRRYSEPMSNAGYLQQEQEGKMYSVIEQTFSAIPVVQAFCREDENDTRFRTNTADILSATLAATNVQFQFKVLMGLTTTVGTAGILWLGARRALHGNLSIGDMLIFLSYLGSLYGPLQSLMYTSSTLSSAAGSARRVREVLETDHEVSDRPNAQPLPRPRGHIRLTNVTFGYEPDRPVLKDVSLEALPGQTLAIVGHTGAGKSTLASLVPRFFDPISGTVTIDSHDLRDVSLASVRQNISVVLQEPFLFPMSIADNIAYGRPDASRSEIHAAAIAANAHEFIERLPEGYDTVIGERGATLSGGERQRISIARALLKDAPILILDEPSSALDARTESLLLEALDRLRAGRTTLIIAHRLSTIRAADQIVVLDGGVITERGTHDELLVRGGQYAHFHAIQFGTSGGEPGGAS